MFRIPGKDDAYNTIEGLKHGGWAQRKRRALTEFGSGWRGLFGGIKNVGKQTAEELESVMAKAPGVDQVSSVLGLAFKGLVTEQEPKGAITFTRPNLRLKPVVFFNKKQTQSILKDFGMSSAESEKIMPIVRMHELSEAHHGVQIIKHKLSVSPRSTEDELLAHIKAREVGQSHHSMAVIGDEALAAASLGRDVFNTMKKFRYEDIRRMSASEPEYARKTRKVYESVEKKWLDKLSSGNSAKNPIAGRDDAYNTISGLLHGGFAQKMRKKFTPFGSGWDPLRNLVADNIGKGPSVFQEFIRSKGFSEALTKGKIVKELGQGAFGEAHLMETTIKVGEQSHTLQYVRKTPLAEGFDKVIPEAKATHAMSDLNAPNIYAVDKERRTYMEFFKGKLAHHVMLKGGAIEENTINDLENFFHEAHKRGYAHLDAIRDASRFHPGMERYSGEYTPYNVMITPEGRAGVFDWGATVPAKTSARFSPFASEDRKSTFGSMETYIGKRLPTAADLDNELIHGLRKQKGKLSAHLTHNGDGTAPTADVSLSDVSAATNKGHKIRSQQTPFPNATFASSSDHSNIRKLGMAKTQKATSAMMFENGRSGGKRSKSAFAASRKG